MYPSCRQSVHVGVRTGFVPGKDFQIAGAFAEKVFFSPQPVMLSGEMAKWSLILMAGVLLHSASFVMEPSTDRKMNKEETGIIIERNTAALFTKKSKDASDKTELMNFLKISSGEYLMAQPLPLCAMCISSIIR